MYTLHKLSEGFIVTSDEKMVIKDTCYQTNYKNTLHALIVLENETQVKFANMKEGSFTKLKVIAQQDQIDFSLVEDKITNCKFPVKIKGNFENEVFKIQNIIGKEYEIPIVWESYKRYKVEANNLEEAVTKALKQFLSEPDNEYIEDSFSIDDIIYDENPNENFDIHKIYNSL